VGLHAVDTAPGIAGSAPGVTADHPPRRLWLIRHGQSEGNVADEVAKASGAATVGIALRDPDVPLSDLGRRQAAALGRLWSATTAGERPEIPDVVLSSPFQRAYATARLALHQAGVAVDIRRDERLRERDLGVFDGLTALGIRERYPDEAARRARLGKFYYRPPRGESWVDVALRVRSVLGELPRDHAGQAVAIFSHQAVLFVLRYVLEGLSEQEILDIDRQTLFRNGGVTTYVSDGGAPLRLVEHDTTWHLEAEGTPATEGHDTHVEV
jgi:2,3-bisphosphoglycerate-dependent phosphoglycerate mutase